MNTRFRLSVNVSGGLMTVVEVIRYLHMAMSDFGWMMNNQKAIFDSLLLLDGVGTLSISFVQVHNDA